MPAGIELDFDREEYTARLEKVRRRMNEWGVDALIISDPSNMAWLTGYDGWSFYVHQAVVVPAVGDPIWWGRNMDVAGAMRTVWMGEECILGYPDNLVQSHERHPMTDLAGVLSDLGHAKDNIGVEMENYYFSAAAHMTLRVTLDGARIIDTTNLVNWCRAIKSPREIALMRRAALITERLHARVVEIMEPGMRKCDLVAEIYATGIRGAEDEEGPFGGDYPAIVPMLPTGRDASAPHLTWDDRTFQTGEGTFFELSGCYKRYHAPQARTVFLGEPTAMWRRVEVAVIEGIDAALEAAVPGGTCADVWSAFTHAINRHGFVKESRIGYSIGLSYPPDWGERTMSLRQDDTSILEPGMCFHLMPAIWLDDWGLEITEPILITEKGAECFCKTPRELFVKS